MKKIFKNVLLSALCIACITSTIISAIPVAYADSSAILGTNVALGSPILNENFVVDDWNKWEMEVWGIYLSNFCQPLVDTYETAFKTGGGGSDGAGYKALCFGSGSDSTNNSVIQGLCDEAILYQKTVTKQIYVTYTNVDYKSGAESEKNTDNADANKVQPRLANFKDLFFRSENPNIISGWSEILMQDLSNNNETLNMTFRQAITDEPNFFYNYGSKDYRAVAHVIESNIPTFWIKNENDKYIKILDYNDSWDLQLSTLLLTAGRMSNNEAQFKEKFKTLMEGEYPIVLDAFGNITTQDKLMIIPAAVNPNLTKEKQINLLNSWVFNGYNSTYSDEEIVTDLKQRDSDNIFVNKIGGLPALASSDKLKGVVLAYYDMDTVIVNNSIYNNVNHYGKNLKAFFDTDITSKNNTYQIKIELAGMDEKYITWFSNLETMAEHTLTTSLLSNELNTENNSRKPKILSELVNTNGKRTNLFDTNNALIAAVQIKNDQEEYANAIRLFWNYIYEVYCGRHGNEAAKWLKDALEDDRADNFYNFKKNVAEELWDDFIRDYPEYKNINWINQWLDFGNNETVNEDGNRLVKVYPISTNMKTIAQALELMDGTEFNTICTLIYATYLDWYGIGNTKTIGGDDPSEFNPEIFDGQSDVINHNINENNLPSKEDREEEVLNLGYLLLNPEKGRDYRKQMIYNGIEDFIYEQYNRIVYGGADSMYSGTASKSNSGFLAIETFANNPFTSWFINSYASVVTWFIMGLVIAIIIIGLLKKRKLSWYFLNIVIAINVILLVPSSGEIVPYITSRFIENMFSSKMTYWAVSEGVANATTELKLQNQLFKSGSDDADSIINTVESLSIVYTDRSLMLKQDISQKLTQKTVGIYNDIQNIRSARWLLPVVMQQITGDNNTTEYLYVKLSNLWDDMSNLYWYYDSGDAEYVTTATLTSKQKEKANTSLGIGEIEKDTQTYEIVKEYFKNYKEINRGDRKNNYNYRSYSYTHHGNNSEQVHLYAWALDSSKHVGIKIPSRNAIGENYKNADSWQEYINSANNNDRINLQKIFNTKTSIELVADQYDRQDRSTISGDYSYLKTTENIAYYFFYVVKDTFSSEYALGKIIGMLQGSTQTGIDGALVRDSFMHATITTDIQGDLYEDGHRSDGYDIKYTPYVRDILDMENLFTNVIPYLYQTQLITGGFDGKSGVLGDSKIEDLQFYKDELQSWMYRCNWATKIMENPELSKPTTVRDSAGNVYTVNNPLLYECYPSDRPMIFSEAQMHAYGLIEADLNLVELKCMEVNKNVCDKWTLLINYAGTSGLTKEVLYRQMALDAALVFNEEFSTLGVLNNLYKLYPQSIDLRYLSFDSVMKMLMLNVSRNSSYVYGDSMQTLISDSDMFQAIILLIDALICASIIPFMRNVLLALIFFLGFLSLIRGILSDGKQKAKVACGQLTSNILFMLMTLVYYEVFVLLMAITSTDEVLQVNQIETSAGNPIWVLIIILLSSGVYVFALIKMIKFCLENYKDMGYEVYSMIASTATEKLQNGLANISSSLSSWAEGLGGSSSSFETSNMNSIKGTGTKNTPTQDVNLKSTDNGVVTLRQEQEYGESFEDMAQHAFATGDGFEFDDSMTADDIDAQIEKGKHM